MSRYVCCDAIGVVVGGEVGVEVGSIDCSKGSAANSVRGLLAGDW